MGSHFFDRLTGRFGRHGGHAKSWPVETRQPTRVVVCPRCWADNKPESRFCSACGTALAQTNETCAACGKALAPGAKFCASCGQAA